MEKAWYKSLTFWGALFGTAAGLIHFFKTGNWEASLGMVSAFWTAFGIRKALD